MGDVKPSAFASQPEVSLNCANDDIDTLHAVIVWYHPDESCIRYVKTLAQWVPVIVVDNTEPEGDSRALNTLRKQSSEANNVTYIENQGNAGIAAAFNRGVQRSMQHLVSTNNGALNNAHHWCVLFDQDSRVDEAFIHRMHRLCKTRDERVAAIAPTYFNQRLQSKGKVIRVMPTSIKKLEPFGSHPIPASYVISSGCAMRLAALTDIGLHDESLFIDFVDIEWGFRAHAAGYRIEVIPELEMVHQLGDVPIILFGRRIVNHSPLRHYYYFRNALLLCRRGYIPLIWKLTEVIKLVPRFWLYALFSDCRLAQIKHMLAGLRDGLLGRSGKKKNT